MLRRTVLPLTILLALGTFLATTTASPAAQDHEETKLAEAMEEIQSDLRKLGKSIAAKDQDASWKLVCSLQGHLLDAKQEVPEKAAGVPEAERTAFVTSFRTRISQLLKATCDVEAAVLGSKFDEAERVVKEVIWPMQKPSHKEFRND